MFIGPLHCRSVLDHSNADSFLGLLQDFSIFLFIVKSVLFVIRPFSKKGFPSTKFISTDHFFFFFFWGPRNGYQCHVSLRVLRLSGWLSLNDYGTFLVPSSAKRPESTSNVCSIHWSGSKETLTLTNELTNCKWDAISIKSRYIN